MDMDIEIRKICGEGDAEIVGSLIDFNLVVCVLCGNKKGIVQRFFQLNVPAYEKFHENIKKTLMNEFGLTYYGFSEEKVEESLSKLLELHGVAIPLHQQS